LSKSTKSKSKRGKAAARKDLRVFYPEYFDQNLSWSQGRRVSKKIAYDNPECRRVAMAAQKAGYAEVFLDKDKHYSRTWFEGNGRVLVTKDGSKEEQLRVIAKNIPKVNLPKPAAKKEPKTTEKKVKKGSAYRQKGR
jgi:signal recognition particle subunit SRP19